MLKIVLLVFAAYIAQTSAQSRPYTSLVWSSCSTAAQTPALRIERLSVLPMPIAHPGLHKADVRAVGLRDINGVLPTTIDIIRTVAGLALPVRCTIVQGLSVGSCSYADLCKNVLNDIADINNTNCPPELADWGIDCNCPFNVPAQTVDGSLDVDIGDLSVSIVSFLANGDFDITAKVNDNRGQHVACFRFLLTIVKRP